MLGMTLDSASGMLFSLSLPFPFFWMTLELAAGAFSFLTGFFFWVFGFLDAVLREGGEGAAFPEGGGTVVRGSGGAAMTARGMEDKGASEDMFVDHSNLMPPNLVLARNILRLDERWCSGFVVWC
jgi:hypothetical protein